MSLRTAARALARPLRAHTRTFYSPFAALSPSPSTPGPSPLTTAPEPAPTEPTPTVYVVSEPHPSERPYDVPAGAYPTSAPYAPLAAAPAPDPAVSASTSSTPAHPVLTRAAPAHDAGVGASAAVRFRSAPGAMGGGDGGLGLMDQEGTRGGEGALAERNPPPIQDVGEEIGKMGLREAWKARK
ncbi:hypothetical protein FA95DRAFT_1609550 [Auriscalpium vulgare]|uniref:Uncharacterized protein n=1 Tax=Auriscalpium vulgare TaxID=40419 RepID=A0ACB8RH62_9AGAM|nr:hypothetical protein FA95DRAFT_1609550 [Auriscalpium vulgare]